ncbi:hypothetical protein LJC48_07740 [Desulfovibrio sp. OttesenSCG-928-C06]|nr:hypothetical protein [Desulfovibrio sp. OttesenSCG-928-C06]
MAGPLNILMLICIVLGISCIMLAQLGMIKPQWNPILRKAKNGGSLQHAFGACVLLAGCFLTAGYAIYTRQVAIVGASIACFCAFIWMARKAREGKQPPAAQ